jgi:hypothetical protein
VPPQLAASERNAAPAHVRAHIGKPTASWAAPSARVSAACMYSMFVSHARDSCMLVHTPYYTCPTGSCYALSLAYTAYYAAWKRKFFFSNGYLCASGRWDNVGEAPYHTAESQQKKKSAVIPFRHSVPQSRNVPVYSRAGPYSFPRLSSRSSVACRGRTTRTWSLPNRVRMYVQSAASGFLVSPC